MHLRACIGVHHDLDLIGHFLRHYRGLGIRHYHLLLHTADAQDPALARAKRLIAAGCRGLECDVRTWVAPHFRADDYKEKLDDLVRHLDDADWVLTVEADEFQAYPNGLQEMLDECVERELDGAPGHFVERLPLGPRLEALRANVPLWRQCPMMVGSPADLGDPRKIVLHRKRITLVPGNHAAEHGTPRLHPRTVEVHHFRWFDNIYQKLDSNRSHPWWTAEREARLRFIRAHLRGEHRCRNT